MKKTCAFAYVTSFCNMDCYHCYVADIRKKRSHMPLELLISFLRYIRAMGYGRIDFLGGEPLLYPWLNEAIGEARRLGLEVLLGTNGTVALKVPFRIDLIAISIDHVPNGKPVRNPSFDATVAANIPKLREKAKQLSFTTTVSKRNKGELASILNFAVESRADYIYFHYFTPLGNGRDAVNDVLEAGDYAELCKWFESVAFEYPIRILYQKKYLSRRELAEVIPLHDQPYYGNRARNLADGLSIFPDSSCHFDPLFFDKEPVAYFTGNSLKFNFSSKELDAMFTVSEKCLACAASGVCGGYDSVYHAFPKAHLCHSLCSDEFIPVETTCCWVAGEGRR